MLSRFVSLLCSSSRQGRLLVSSPSGLIQPGTPIRPTAPIVFFRNLGHMGMYIGGGNFIHAPHTGDVVTISPLSDPYYVANWVGAKRVL